MKVLCRKWMDDVHYHPSVIPVMFSWVSFSADAVLSKLLGIWKHLAWLSFNSCHYRYLDKSMASMKCHHNLRLWDVPCWRSYFAGGYQTNLPGLDEYFQCSPHSWDDFGIHLVQNVSSSRVILIAVATHSASH